MPRTSSKVVNFFKDADDIARIITGRRIPTLAARTLELLGGDTKKTGASVEEPAFDPTDAYCILQVRREACDTVVKASYRNLVRDVHPDTGEHPDSKRFQELTEAYNKIMTERKRKEK